MTSVLFCLFKPRVLRFGLNQHRHIRVAILPQREEIFVCLPRSGFISHQRQSSRHSQVRERVVLPPIRVDPSSPPVCDVSKLHPEPSLLLKPSWLSSPMPSATPSNSVPPERS